MALFFTITDKQVGTGCIFSQKHQMGEKFAVPLYEMTITNESGSVEKEAVTRDTLHTIDRGKRTARYILHGECPPNHRKRPYQGIIRDDGELGFRVQLYEENIQQEGQYLLRGHGRIKRQYIQIHIGPGYSEGCFLLTDDVVGRNRFQEKVERLMREDRRNGYDDQDFTAQVLRRS